MNRVEIRLPVLPVAENPVYDQQIPLAVECGVCHFDQWQDWTTSNHSFAGDDAWVLDLFSGTGTPGGGAGYVFRDLHDPDDTGFCATCHTPMADVFDPGGVFLDEVTVPGALQGVVCVACHQIDSVSDATWGAPPTVSPRTAPRPASTSGGRSTTSPSAA